MINTGKVDKMQRQCAYLETKLDEDYDVIRDNERLYLDQRESEKMIDDWTMETEKSLKPAEDAIETFSLRITEEESRKIERERKQKT